MIPCSDLCGLQRLLKERPDIGSCGFLLPQSLRVVSHQAPSGWLTLSNRTSVTTSERKIRILRLVRLILTTDY